MATAKKPHRHGRAMPRKARAPLAAKKPRKAAGSRKKAGGGITVLTPWTF